MTTSQEKGDSYEEFICQLIGNVKENGRDIRSIKWGRNNNILGASGCKHQIDVSFIDHSFKKPTLVLIECKNTSKSVEKVQIAAFQAIISDILNHNKSPEFALGIFAYAQNARSGAVKFAKHYNIKMEKTGVRPNFTFHYKSLTQAGILFKGTGSLIANATIAKS